MRDLCQTLALLVFLCAGSAASARGIDIEQSSHHLEGGDLEVGLKATLTLDDTVRDAVDNGITLYFEVETILLRSRHLWPDERIASTTRRYALSRHALSARYALMEQGASQARTFPGFAEALAALGEIPQALRYPANRLIKLETYVARSRLRLVTEELPAPMRPLVWISPAWWISSPWHEWIVAP